jgi:hypothetical protein
MRARNRLVEAGRQKESREFREVFFAQIAPAVEIVAPGLIAGGKMSLVDIDIAGEAARD